MDDSVLISCTGKFRYETFEQAKRVAGRNTRRNSSSYDIYHCHFCGGFHIGNKRAFKRREKRPRPVDAKTIL